MYTFVVVPGIVVIGPAEALASLRAQVANGGQVQTFTDHQVREAVEYIATYKPAVVAIDEKFAVSPRGEALVGRIMDDSGLAQCEIRILARAAGRNPSAKDAQEERGGHHASAAPGVGPAAAAEAVAVSAALDRRGTRRAERIRMLDRRLDHGGRQPRGAGRFVRGSARRSCRR